MAPEDPLETPLACPGGGRAGVATALRVLAGGGLGAQLIGSGVPLVREYKGAITGVRGAPRARRSLLPGRRLTAATTHGQRSQPGSQTGVLLRGPGHRRRGLAPALRALLWLWSIGLLALLLSIIL